VLVAHPDDFLESDLSITASTDKSEVCISGFIGRYGYCKLNLGMCLMSL